jgi:hypothetical protein
MKKLIFSFAFFLALGIVAANAQCAGASAGKSCCAGKISKAAAADPSIEMRKADDGTVAYVRKEADTQGNVKFVSVQFDEASNAFVNVAPKTMTVATDDKAGMTKKSCTAAEMKNCTAGEKKACAGKEGKACCAGKAAAETKEQ